MLSLPSRASLHRLTIIVLLCAAFTLRSYGIAWDAGYRFHPDERFLIGVADSLAWPDRWSALIDVSSPLNPFWDTGAGTMRHVPYGHVPVYLVRLVAPIVAPLVGASLQDDAALGAGRLLAVLADTVAVGLTYVLGRRLYGTRAGLLAAAASTFAVLHVQQAHVYTADIVLTPITVGLLLVLVRFVSEGTADRLGRYSLSAGILFGLAVGTKATALLLLAPLVVAHLLPAWNETSLPLHRFDIRTYTSSNSAWSWFGPSVLAGATAFALTNPYALLDWRMLIQSLAIEAGMVRGRWIAPFTQQYLDTLPYLYPIVQQARWFLGPTLTVFGWCGFVWAIYRLFQGRLAKGEVILMAWALPFVVLVGGLFAKFPRYWLPLVPVLFVLGSGWLTTVAHSPRRQNGVALVVLLPAVFYALAYSRVYAERHPWLQASEWIYRNVPAGASLVVERWDHALPVPMTVDGRERSPDEYRQIEVDSYDEPAEFEAALVEADAVVLPSRRVWAVVVRQPDRYPRAADLYRMLLSGETAYDIARIWRVVPRLGGVAVSHNPFTDAGLPTFEVRHSGASPGITLDLGPADEGFSVYDHPLTIVLHR